MLNNAIRFWLIIVFLISSCQPLQNFLEPDSPKFEGDFSNPSEFSEGFIKVVTWNIRYSLETEKAINELHESEELNGADFLLLQEVDEKSVKSIAESLQYAYIYYPASKHTYHNKNFGNAVLSKWPIIQTQKLILPNQNPKNQQKRIAVKAIVKIGYEQVSVYSIHTETNWMNIKKRDEQIDYLRKDVGDDERMIIIGGDFNTLTHASVRNLENRFAKTGMVQASEGADHSVNFWGFQFPMDHIFTNNFRIIENGVWKRTNASDHFPIWVVLESEE